MKLILPLMAICTLTLDSFAQDTTLQLDFNNVNAIITNKGHFFNDDVNSMPGYEIPKGSGLNAIYTSAFWYAAENDTGAIFTCLGGYGMEYDVDRGPY